METQGTCMSRILEGKVMVLSVEVQPYCYSPCFIHYPKEDMCLRVNCFS